MKSKQAAHYFHGEEGYNCAQAVLKAFQPESGMSELTIRSATVAGGGRAKDGVCGALYAAQIILGPGDASDEITESFQKNTGSVRCSDIRKTECGCRNFVSMVSELTTPYLEKVDGEDEEYRSSREKREVEMLPQVKE
ncbi:C-GCAxxG-C-C family (seleno)protein [Vibrio sp. SCSIO 43137]|uniref:C-GCAxxG-C-C family (seleno)protein n=1 Tax=Vibrio sp. SCSIO 43137 TaxID=3021011 RepID=UPI0023072A30|nr:C-GCAxxG-C-C family (seleno)protein [Vibrio sp. SCSIO 43137]WCE29100.1 C-GCAxxG-C-C family (seleno)protein [Vibrio sp. SCSIO 43137]